MSAQTAVLEAATIQQQCKLLHLPTVAGQCVGNFTVYIMRWFTRENRFRLAKVVTTGYRNRRPKINLSEFGPYSATLPTE